MIILFVFLNIVTLSVSSECPIGWINGGSSCYHVSEQRLDWLSSQEYCWSRGGHLAEFSSLEEENTVDAFLSEDELYWIGLTDVDVEGTWTWGSGQEPSYTNWEPSEPNGGSGQNCVMKWFTGYAGQWNDYYCKYDFAQGFGPIHALCQMENGK